MGQLNLCAMVMKKYNKILDYKSGERIICRVLSSISCIFYILSFISYMAGT